MNFRLAEIGITIIVGHILLVGFFSHLIPLAYHLGYGFCVFFQTVLFDSLLTIIGFILYIIGRKSFLKHIKGSRTISVLLVFLSFIPIMEGIFFFILALAFGIRGSNPNPIPFTWEESTSQTLAVVLFILRISSAALLFADGLQLKLNRFEVLPSKQKVDLLQTKYPKDLFAKYVEQYPHNAEGVLEWHIHKKMKEGKTREQAIKELHE